MASYAYTFQNGDVVTPAKLNDARTVSNIQTADIANGAITSEKLGSDIILVPAGAVMPFAMNLAPSGWLAANGAAVSRTTYATLFNAIGTTYGTGNGSTTFNLPDLQGYFVRGAGTNSDGTASATFGAKQADAVKNHTHSGSTGHDSPDHTHQVYRTISTFRSGDREIDGDSRSTDDWFAAESTSSGASTRHQHSFTTSSQSPAGATETRPANIALLYCIKF
jgi:microcystin-dependent protein